MAQLLQSIHLSESQTKAERAREITKNIEFIVRLAGLDLTNLKSSEAKKIIEDLDNFLRSPIPPNQFINSYMVLKNIPAWTVETLQSYQSQIQPLVHIAASLNWVAALPEAMTKRRFRSEEEARQMFQEEFQKILKPQIFMFEKVGFQLGIGKGKIHLLFTSGLEDAFCYSVLMHCASNEFYELVRRCPICEKIFIRKGKEKFDNRKCAVTASVRKFRKKQEEKQQEDKQQLTSKPAAKGKKRGK